MCTWNPIVKWARIPKEVWCTHCVLVICDKVTRSTTDCVQCGCAPSHQPCEQKMIVFLFKGHLYCVRIVRPQLSVVKKRWFFSTTVKYLLFQSCQQITTWNNPKLWAMQVIFFFYSIYIDFYVSNRLLCGSLIQQSWPFGASVEVTLNIQTVWNHA